MFVWFMVSFCMQIVYQVTIHLLVFMMARTSIVPDTFCVKL